VLSAGLLPAVLLLGAVLLLAPQPTARLDRWGPGPGRVPLLGVLRARGRLHRAPRRPARGRVALAAAELAALLRAGATPAAAWSHLVGPPGPAAGGPGTPGPTTAAAQPDAGTDEVTALLRRAAGAAARGGDVGQALTTGPCPPDAAAPLAALAAAWRVAERTGAPTADVLDRLAAGLRADAQVQDARDAALAAPRATARLLVALPLAGLALGAAVGADPLRVLVATGPGRFCGAAGVACTAAAWAWTRALVRTAEGPR
jgi:tight adherence protein B